MGEQKEVSEQVKRLHKRAGALRIADMPESASEMDEAADTIAALQQELKERDAEVTRWKDEAINACNLIGEIAGPMPNPTASAIVDRLRDETRSVCAMICEGRRAGRDMASSEYREASKCAATIRDDATFNRILALKKG